MLGVWIGTGSGRVHMHENSRAEGGLVSVSTCLQQGVGRSSDSGATTSLSLTKYQATVVLGRTTAVDEDDDRDEFCTRARHQRDMIDMIIQHALGLEERMLPQ